MKAFLLLALAFVAGVLAADPTQPKVGQTPVINATNGYGGILTVRTQVNVGYPGQTGILTISPADTNLTATFTVDTNGTIQATSEAIDGIAGLIFNSSVAHTSGNLMEVKNNGVKALSVSSFGRGNFGNAEATDGWFNENFPGVSSISFRDNDGQGFTDHTLQSAINNTYLNNHDGSAVVDMYAQSQTGVDANDAHSYIGWFAYDSGLLSSRTGIESEAYLDGGRRRIYFSMFANSEYTLYFDPTADEGQTPYLFDTSVAHTTGNLAEWNNNGDARLLLDAIQSLTLQTTVSNKPPTIYLKGIATDTVSSTLSGIFTDNNGVQEAGRVNIGEASPWTGGSAGQRDGFFSVNVLHDNTMQQRHFIDGDTGTIYWYDRDGNNTVSFSNGGAITTTVPTGATNAQPFKIGDVATGSGLVLVTTNYVQMEINGVLVKLAIVK